MVMVSIPKAMPHSWDWKAWVLGPGLVTVKGISSIPSGLVL